MDTITENMCRSKIGSGLELVKTGNIFDFYKNTEIFAVCNTVIATAVENSEIWFL